MKIINTAIEGVYIIEPQIFEDNRGYFFESYNQAKMKEAGISNIFIQDNQSKSRYGTIRGVHFRKGNLLRQSWCACFRERFWTLLSICARGQKPSVSMLPSNCLPRITASL